MQLLLNCKRNQVVRNADASREAHLAVDHQHLVMRAAEIPCEMFGSAQIDRGNGVIVSSRKDARRQDTMAAGTGDISRSSILNWSTNADRASHRQIHSNNHTPSCIRANSPGSSVSTTLETPTGDEYDFTQQRSQK
jgi:hypothetical protein